MNKISKTVSYANELHRHQTRKGVVGLAYTHHLAEVAALVGAFGGDEEAIAAAWLHDAVEDAEATLADIEALCGPTVAGYVAEVTDDPNLDKASQRAAQIASAPHKSPAAALIKAADQISNLRSIVASPPGWEEERRAAYVQKASDVVAGLRIPQGLREAFVFAAEATHRL
jgi:(p)ppGpp synthase/HD superfamily hydrolase